MVEKVPAAVKMGPNETVYREFDMPEIPEDGALIKVEIAGICGSDVKNYAKKIDAWMQTGGRKEIAANLGLQLAT